MSDSTRPHHPTASSSSRSGSTGSTSNRETIFSSTSRQTSCTSVSSPLRTETTGPWSSEESLTIETAAPGPMDTHPENDGALLMGTGSWATSDPLAHVEQAEDWPNATEAS
ncbi:hypothetical protein MAP00_000816 [Monascus purpureus]|nr:hypothetical protein MAP00_000816 [Monascus purpureus]